MNKIKGGNMGDVCSLDEKVLSHEYELKGIKEILTSVASNQKETSIQVNLLANSINKLDLYLEKQNNLETRHAESITRLHKRIDGVDTVVNRLEDLVTECKLTKKDIETVTKRVDTVESHEGKVVWAILSAVGMAILGLVIN